jgi:hypothetical protein
MSAQPKRQQRQRRPVYFIVRKMADVATGEICGALVPLTPWDRRAMRERKYHVNTEVRAELKQSRNVKFHRLTHALGALLVDRLESFAGLDAHSALKRVQRECGSFCEETTVEMPGLGQLVMKLPRSIAFDEMDEGEFQQLWQEITRYICANYLPDLDPDAIEAALELMTGTDA